MNVRILYQDQYIVAVDKPAGFQVHTPTSMAAQGRTLRSKNVMRMVRDQIGKYVYPVHRLDRATSGVLIFALESKIAGQLQAQFKSGNVEKIYVAFVRGWLPDEGRIESVLEEEKKKVRDEPVEDELLTLEEESATDYRTESRPESVSSAAITLYSTIFRSELPIPSGKHLTSRYSFVEVKPQTGRYHQIRKHFKSLSHPLIGDSVYGDGKHNRVWREKIKGSSLFLKARELHFDHPVTGERMRLVSKWGKHWHSLFDEVGCCVRSTR